MARFASAQFRRGPRGGAQILSSGSLREMHRVRVLESNWTQGNAIGFAVRKAGDKVYVAHGGSYPGYQTNTMLWPDGKVGVIVLTNADDANPAALATELMNTVGQAVAKAAAKPPAVPTWDSSWSRFAGLYRGLIRATGSEEPAGPTTCVPMVLCIGARINLGGRRSRFGEPQAQERQRNCIDAWRRHTIGRRI
jgi:hypothetical protein